MNSNMVRFAEDIQSVCRMKQGFLASKGCLGDKNYELLGVVIDTARYVVTGEHKFNQRFVDFVKRHKASQCTVSNCESALGSEDIKAFVKNVKLEDSKPVPVPPKFTDAFDFVHYFLVTDPSKIESWKTKFGKDYMDKFLLVGTYIMYVQVVACIDYTYGGNVKDVMF